MTLKARIQLQQLSAYGTLQRGHLAVVVLVDRDVVCPFSGLSLFDVVHNSTADWPSVNALEHRWVNPGMAGLRISPCRFIALFSLAVLRSKALVPPAIGSIHCYRAVL